MGPSSIFIRYVAVGLGSFLVDYLVFLMLLRGVELKYLTANAIGFLAGLATNFFFNGRLTFGLQGSLGRPLVRYMVLASLSLGLGSLLLEGSVGIGGLAPELAKILVAAFTVSWNFVLYRHFVFREARP